MTARPAVAISLDLGTTALKAGLLGPEGKIETLFTESAPPVTADGGRCESDARAYLDRANGLLEQCLNRTGKNTPLGLSCQRSSFLLWRRADGRPVTPLISWQDSRGAKVCREVRAEAGKIGELTGLRATPYYCAPKLALLLRQNPHWLKGLTEGGLMAGTLDTFLIWRWTCGQNHQTDASMAARTLLMDIRRGEWSSTLCGLFAVPLKILPAIRPSAGLNTPLDNGLTLAASVADQSAALYAAVRDEKSEALVNLGTGGFVIRYLGDDRSEDFAGYLRTLVYQDAGFNVHLALEGTLNSIAAALTPYPYRECRIGDLAQLPGLFCLAEPSGLGAPYFREELGLFFSAPVDRLSRRQVACLLLEAVVFRIVRILEDFDRRQSLDRVYLAGGLAAVPALKQGIARLCPFEVHLLAEKEASLRGAGLLAAGLPPAFGRESVKLDKIGDPAPLRGKFRRWKNWFDRLVGPGV